MAERMKLAIDVVCLVCGRPMALNRAISQPFADDGDECPAETIEFRWANNQIDRSPALAAELVRFKTAVIFASGGPIPARAAAAATLAIPIVFAIGDDPVQHGLVASGGRRGCFARGQGLTDGGLKFH